MTTTIDPAEVEKFSQLSATWWDENGPFKPLHRFNPVRIAYIRDQVCGHWQRSSEDIHPLHDLSLLDIGCGGGLLSEPMTRLGATVTGIDAAEKNIRTASLHAQQSGLAIDYRATTAEDLATLGVQYDVILSVEIVEHVADLSIYMQACASLLKPGGLLFVATLNRTAKSYVMAIVGAEYILRWLPIGTHDWQKFVKPSELQALAMAQHLQLKNLSGMVYNPLTQTWHRGRDVSVNYVATFQKAHD